MRVCPVVQTYRYQTQNITYRILSSHQFGDVRVAAALHPPL